MNKNKIFTVTEANNLIPQLSIIIEKLQNLYNLIIKKQVEIDTLELINYGDQKPKKHTPTIEKELKYLNELYYQFQNLIKEINELGCSLKDIHIGLIDFQAKKNNEIVNLCWKLGEPHISHWHSLDSGFQSRQPIDKDFF